MGCTMSDTGQSVKFGQQPSETKKNPKVFNLRVKIQPYVHVSSSSPKRKDEKFDPFAVKFESPKPEDY